MKDLQKATEGLNDWLVELGLVEMDPTLLAALALGMFAVLIALISLRKARKSADPQHVAARVTETIQQLNLKLDDLNGQWGRELTKLDERVKLLEERIDTLATAIRTSRDAVEKKKTLAPSRDVKPSPVAEQPVPAEPAPTPAAVVADEEIAPTSLESGLQKTRTGLFGKLKSFLASGAVDAELEEGLEELLISSDLGVNTTRMLLEQLRGDAKELKHVDEAALNSQLKQIIKSILSGNEDPEIVPERRDGQPLVIVMVGVNGVGKTTTIAKLGRQFRAKGAKVLFAAGDTFRAAAVEQLKMWGDRVGAEVVAAPEGAKPATVAYQAVHKAQLENFDVVILDTAGRLHTRVNLMNELRSVFQIIDREQPGAPHHTLLVLDASTGQNALQQAREFNSLEELSGIVVTKLDGTPKGGIVVAIKEELGIPIRYIGVGESAADLRPFSAEEFVEALFVEEEVAASTRVEDSTKTEAARPRARRRRREGNSASA